MKKKQKHRRLRTLTCIITLVLYVYNVSIWIPVLLLIIFEQRDQIRQIVRKLTGKTLFDGQDAMFKKNIIDINVYGEYGVGTSTSWVFNNTKAKILSVDTSMEWINDVKSKINSSDRAEIDWVDLGQLGDWGRPATYKKRKYFFNYIHSIWSKEDKPELVLIDGRFRVACFLFSLISASAGTKIIFDDYVNRKHYHVIEEFVQPIETYCRQALFIVPKELDIKNIKKTIEQFTHVIN